MFAIGLRQIFSFRRILPPTLCCSPKQHDSQDAHCNRSQPARNTSITFFGRLSQQPFTRQRYLQIRTSRPQFPRHKAGDFRIELFPLHSPLLGESLLVSFPPLSNMFKFSGSSYLSSALDKARIRCQLEYLSSDTRSPNISVLPPLLTKRVIETINQQCTHLRPEANPVQHPPRHKVRVRFL